MKEIGITKGCAQAEYVVPLWMFGYRLHNRTVDDYKMFGRRFDGPILLRLARIEQQRCALETDPVAFPTTLSRQFDLVLFSQ